MPKKSTRSLLDDIAELPPAEAIEPAWWATKLSQADPKTYAQLVEVVDNFIAGGVVKSRFKTVAALHRYLCGKDRHRPRQPLITVEHNTFRRFVAMREDAHNG